MRRGVVMKRHVKRYSRRGEMPGLLPSCGNRFGLIAASMPAHAQYAEIK